MRLRLKRGAHRKRLRHRGVCIARVVPRENRLRYPRSIEHALSKSREPPTSLNSPGAGHPRRKDLVDHCFILLILEARFQTSEAVIQHFSVRTSLPPTATAVRTVHSETDRPTARPCIAHSFR
jgi:hypothetical protein